jgi:hypothetical protein
VSDVSAVLLSIGEVSVDRARRAIEMQSLPAREIVVVENVSPFHRALNQGAREVSAPYFVQVDADMVLDPGCFEELRGAVRDDTGIVVGELRDPMMGQTVGVKLFRRECFEATATSDSVSPDTDFVDAIARRGWKTVYVGRPHGSMHASHTLGDHDPQYSPSYVMAKYLLEGARLRYRGARGGLRWRAGRLAKSEHGLAPLALVALGHGFFEESTHDGLVPVDRHPDADTIVQLLEPQTGDTAGAPDLIRTVETSRMSVTFERFLEAGRESAMAGAGAMASEVLAALRRSKQSWRYTVATIAFGHGLVGQIVGGIDVSRDLELMKEFLSLGVPVNAGTLERGVARVRHAIGRISRPGSTRW